MIKDAEGGAGLEGFSRWRSSALHTFGELEYEPLSPSFQGSLAPSRLGELQFVTVSTSALKVTHSKLHRDRGDQDCHYVGLVNEGKGILSLRDRDLDLCQDDIFMYSGGEVYDFVIPESLCALFIQVPNYIASEYLSRKRMGDVTAVSGRTGTGYIASSLIGALLHQVSCIGSDEGDVLVDTLLTTVSLAVRDAPSSLSGVRRQRPSLIKRVKAFIEAHLDEEDLSPARIALAHRVSQRYLNKIFAREDLTPSRYILQRRLAKCGHALRDRQLLHLGIGEVAFSYGFNDLSTFCRAFRNEFGQTAREYRLQHTH